MKVLVLGGYGGFGARLARRLADDGHEVLVAGRSQAKAEAFCAGRPRLTPLALDRDGDLAARLRQLRPFALIDAAGPFQGLGYHVAKACLAAGCHYIDLADGRDFVVNIGELDAAARSAGLCVLSGASSVPALSGAVARHLVGHVDEVRSVEMAISASNKATAGPSVTAAILSYVGRPIPLWRGRRMEVGHGWQDLRRIHFHMPGVAALPPRLVGLCDVPDLALLPARLPGRPAVVFRAGTELAIENLALWMASWLVRWRCLPSLARFGGAAIRLKRLTKALGTDRSAMVVRLFGTKGSARLEARWTLIAEHGDGPEIPALAAPILLDKLARGRLAPGARDAGEDLTLADFEPSFAALAIRHATEVTAQPPSLYARVMGPAFLDLPPAVRAMHEVLGGDGASGEGHVTRGPHPLARAIGALLRFPAAGTYPLHVAFAERGGIETWRRIFGPYSFSSELAQRGSLLTERFGPLRFGFALPPTHAPAGLVMHLTRWWVGPLPLPLAWAPRITAREFEDNGRFCFDVAIRLPLVGLIVAYSGWLSRER